MEWKKEYEVGVEEIDQQHKKLVNLVNLYKKHLSDDKVDSYKEIGEILVYLVNYSSFHFAAEEALMDSINYPGLDEHRKIHKELIAKIKDVLIKMKNKESYTKIEFYYFLMSWVNDHILDEDIKIGTFCRENNQVFKPLRSQLERAESVISVVKPNIERVDQLYSQGEITEEEREVQRFIFLENYYGNFLIDKPLDLLAVLSSIELIYKKGIIITSEVIGLLELLDVNKRLVVEPYSNSDAISQLKNIVEKLRTTTV